MNEYEFSENLNKYYNKITLVELYKHYFSQWIEKGYVASVLSPTLATQEVQNSKKDDLLHIIRQFYINPEVTQKIYNSLSKPVQYALVTIAWHGSMKATEFERIVGTTVVSRENYRHNNNDAGKINPDFRLFLRYDSSGDYSYWGDEKNREPQGNVYLYTILCKPLRKNLPKPVGYTIQPVKNIKTDFIHNCMDEAVSQIELYYTYAKDGNIKSTSKTCMPTPRSAAAMQKYCQIKEFFTDSDLSSVKTTLIGTILNGIVADEKPSKGYSYDSPADLLKQIILYFFSGLGEWPIREMFFPYVKGWGVNTKNSNGKSVIKLLLNLPGDNSWVSIENIFDFIKYREIDFELCDESQYGYSELYISVPSEWRSRERMTIKGEDKQKFIIHPFIKGIFFLLSAFGIVEIGFGMPTIHKEFLTNEKYFSVFEGLQTLRLTKLGRYVLGHDKTYKGHIEIDDGKVTLDSYSLIATILEENKIIRLALDSIGNKLDNNRYEVSFESLYKDCQNLDDVKRKIQLFKTKVAANPPGVWVAFFKNALDHSNPVMK